MIVNTYTVYDNTLLIQVLDILPDKFQQSGVLRGKRLHLAGALPSLQAVTTNAILSSEAGMSIRQNRVGAARSRFSDN